MRKKIKHLLSSKSLMVVWLIIHNEAFMDSISYTFPNIHKNQLNLMNQLKASLSKKKKKTK